VAEYFPGILCHMSLCSHLSVSGAAGCRANAELDGHEMRTVSIPNIQLFSSTSFLTEIKVYETNIWLHSKDVKVLTAPF